MTPLLLKYFPSTGKDTEFTMEKIFVFLENYVILPFAFWGDKVFVLSLPESIQIAIPRIRTDQH